MQFYLRNNFDKIANYIQIILELYINICQRIRFESMSSRKIMQYHSLSRCWWKRMQILSVTAAINIYVVVVWPIWAWNLIRKHGFPSIAKCMVTKIKDISYDSLKGLQTDSINDYYLFDQCFSFPFVKPCSIRCAISSQYYLYEKRRIII